LFLGNDPHFTPRGHQLYADVLAQFITEHLLIEARETAKR
jgi:hypothetical protein